MRRFASGLYPLDEALVEVALDLSGRPFVVWEVELPEASRSASPPFDPQLAEHAVHSFATAAGITLHVTLRRGRNVHHIIEATFKGLARCLRDAVRVEGERRAVDQGRAVTRAGRAAAGRRARLRHRQPALGPEGAGPRGRRRPAHRRPGPDRATPPPWCCPASVRSGRAWTRSGGPAWRTSRTTRSPPAGRSSASASACRCCSTRSEEDPARARARRDPRARCAGSRRREAAADAVEPAAACIDPDDPLFAGLGPSAVGVLRPLAARRARRPRRRGRHLRVRRPRSTPPSAAATCSPRSSTPRSRAPAGLALLRQLHRAWPRRRAGRA